MVDEQSWGAQQQHSDSSTAQHAAIPDPAVQHGDLSRPLSDEDKQTIAALRPGTALLIALGGPNIGARFLLDAPLVSAGRHPDSDIFLDDVTVSRKHAVFELHGDTFTVRDVGSLNGTYVNRQMQESCVLQTGDVVQIGKFKLSFFTNLPQLA